MIDVKNMKLGKLEHKEDERTLRVSQFLAADVQVPVSYDFDYKRTAFPGGPMGNLTWGNCVIVGRANQLMRLERSESRRNPRINEAMAVTKYKQLTGAVSPGDRSDRGLVVLDALRDWRKNGWDIGAHNYNIAAFGFLEPRNQWLLRASCYLFTGIQLGIWLPISAQAQTRQGYWDVTEGPGSEHGSWGGHLVTAFRYDADNFYVKTWGQDVRVTNNFINKYADEAWSVIDNLNIWSKSKRILNVEGMIQRLRSFGVKIEL